MILFYKRITNMILSRASVYRSQKSHFARLYTTAALQQRRRSHSLRIVPAFTVVPHILVKLINLLSISLPHPYGMQLKFS